MDLKDKILKSYQIEENEVVQGNTNKEEALSALEVLGFNAKQSDKVLNNLLKTEPELSVEQLIKKALKSL